MSERPPVFPVDSRVVVHDVNGEDGPKIGKVTITPSEDCMHYRVRLESGRVVAVFDDQMEACES